MTNSHFFQNYNCLPTHFYSEIETEQLSKASLLHSNQALMQQLGLNLDETSLLNMTSGQTFPPGLQALAQKYTGHQFGYYNPDLGDGRGVLLGQFNDTNNQQWDLHLKGSGQTPYSRRGDGRAVLRSSVREYLIGEALHHLGIPTTRCLSLCTSPEMVQREIFEPRASYIRIAKTHIRFGHFEWLKQQGDIEQQQQLADYVIEYVYPELKTITDSNLRYAELLNSIVSKTAVMIAGWQKVGFCHGVMNTDNMSVAGETFDFGPYAFLDDCKIHYICNHSDTEGRYAFSQQPNIGLWNCQILGFAFSDLVTQEQIDQAINLYIDTFNKQYLLNMGNKFGLAKPDQDDKLFIAETLILMDKSQLDFHHFFVLLKEFDSIKHHQFETFVLQNSENNQAWSDWIEKFRARLKQQKAEQFTELMQQTPQVILRNYIAQEIIEAAENQDLTPLNNWMKWLQNPHKPAKELLNIEQHDYLSPPEKQNKGLALSCSS